MIRPVGVTYAPIPAGQNRRNCRACNRPVTATVLETVAVYGRPDLDLSYPLCAEHAEVTQANF